MPEWVALGYYGEGYGLVIDFRRKRGMVRTNTDLVQGTPLEVIPPGSSGYAPGIVLIRRDWQDLYFVIEREGWEEDDYFEYAEKRIQELKIKNP